MSTLLGSVQICEKQSLGFYLNLDLFELLTRKMFLTTCDFNDMLYKSKMQRSIDGGRMELEGFKKNTIICAVKNNEQIDCAIASKADNIVLLKANINTIDEIVERIHSANKKVFIHIDLAEGFGKDEASIEYISKHVKPDGVLSTKINIIKLCSERNMFAVYRVFLIDQQSMDSAIYNIKKFKPCAVEIMPGIAYEAIKELSQQTNIALIAGGFIRTKENVKQAFDAGAIACSTSKHDLWNYDLI